MDNKMDKVALHVGIIIISNSFSTIISTVFIISFSIHRNSFIEMHKSVAYRGPHMFMYTQSAGYW
jgi:hypothetical protein